MFGSAPLHILGRFMVACVALAATAGAAISATESRRVALVVGNGGYTSIPSLPNPTRDAQLIAQKLRSVGFDVEMAVDGTRAQLEQSVRSFGRRATGADAALFYYAGHGIQSNGQNYLLPVNAVVGEVADLRYEAMPLSLVTEELEYANAKISLLVLDACRDNPLTRSLRGRGSTRSTDVSQGLASVHSATGMLIAYSTAPGDVAYDGEGSQNSPFTQALADWIEQPGLEVALMFRRVREQVVNATGGKQRPWVEEAILGDFYFQPGASSPAAPPVAVLPTAVSPQQQFDQPAQRQDDGSDAVAVAWASARSVNTRGAYEQFIALYPDSLFARQASIFLSQLPQSTVLPQSTAPTASADVPASGQVEEQQRKRTTTTIRIIENDDEIPGLY